MHDDIATSTDGFDSADQAPRSADGVLRLTERELRAIARDRHGRTPVAWIFLRQGLAERRLARRVQYRHRENQKACDAYCAMSPAEFEAVNARQAWANWRTIPRNLAGALPTWPVSIVDLCCGTGQSTAVLACYAAAGSRVLGLEYVPAFVELARSRTYRQREGAVADVTFNAQSVLDTFRGADGAPLADRSVDLVNASGSVGNHFDAAATRVLADEIDRVLKPRGLAMIDSGEDGTDGATLSSIFAERGFAILHRHQSHPLDRYTQICMRKNG